MKKIVKKVVKIAEPDLKSLLGQRVMVLCLNYFYVGKLASLGRTCARLEDASIVYETGEWGAPSWKDAQAVRRPLYVRLGCIEAFMPEKP
jgi:hypothetical protein